MISITPLTAEEAIIYAREFFRPEFRDCRLGNPGLWLGLGAGPLRLPPEVELDAFQNLLRGWSQDGSKDLLEGPQHKDRIAAWMVTYSASQSLSVLWAMAPAARRPDVELAHGYATFRAAEVLEDSLTYSDLHLTGRKTRAKGIIAEFRCGTNWDQTPHLHTTSFLFNLGPKPEGPAEQFRSEAILSWRDTYRETYFNFLMENLRDHVGVLKFYGGMDLRLCEVPQEVTQRFFFGSSQGLIRPGEPLEGENVLRGEKLFGKWQEQGEALGWGPRQAAALLAKAKRHQLYLDAMGGCREKLDSGLKLVRGARVRI